MSGRYTVSSSSGELENFITDCCSFDVDGGYALEIENVGGGVVNIVSIMLDDFREQFSLLDLDVADACSTDTSLGAAENCKIGVAFVNSDKNDPEDDGLFGDGPPDGILVDWGESNLLFIALEVSPAP